MSLLPMRSRFSKFFSKFSCSVLFYILLINFRFTNSSLFSDTIFFFRKFRVVHANTFLDHFASNRSHMIDFDRMGSGGQRERARSISGEGRERTESTDQYRKRAKSIVYTQPPPSWPPIYGPKADTDMNLTHYIDMDPSTDSDIFGKVYSLKDFIAFGSSNA